MRWAYLLQGVLFLGVILIAMYAMQPKKSLDNSDTIQTNQSPMTTTLSITSPLFDNNGRVPPKYTCDGSSVSPPLAFSGVPENAKSLALIIDDPDVPKQLNPDGMFDHWILFNIPPATSGIPEGKSAGTAGANGAGGYSYYGPCPPPQYEPKEHRYVFTLYALDAELLLKEGATKQEVLKAMEGHVIQKAQVIGRYSRV